MREVADKVSPAYCHLVAVSGYRGHISNALKLAAVCTLLPALLWIYTPAQIAGTSIYNVRSPAVAVCDWLVITLTVLMIGATFLPKGYVICGVVQIILYCLIVLNYIHPSEIVAIIVMVAIPLSVLILIIGILGRYGFKSYFQNGQFPYTNVTKHIFTYCCFTSVSFANCSFENVLFQWCKFEECDFNSCSFAGCRIVSSQVDSITLHSLGLNDKSALKDVINHRAD